MFILKNEMAKKFLGKLHRLMQIMGHTRKYYRSDRILHSFFKDYNKKSTSIALDVGSGPEPKNPFNSNKLYGVDFRENKINNVVYADLSMGKLPFENETFDFISAYDVLEHIERISKVEGNTIFPFILLMNEIFRVLKPNGIFFNIQPVYPSKSAFQDPTHVNIMSEDTMDYYFCEKSWARIYGYEGSFALLEDGWIGEKYFSFMKKDSDIPIRDLNFKQE